MRLLKNIGAGMKNVARGIGKSMHVLEKGISAADKASGGALRAMAAGATGGLSETALGAYKQNKGMIKKGLEATERVGNITERVGKTGKLAGSGAYSFAKQHSGARAKDYMEQGEQFLEKNPKISAGITKATRGNIKPNFRK
jgi:hypothetical protein